MNTLTNLTAVTLATIGLALAGCGETESHDDHDHASDTHSDATSHDDHMDHDDHDHGEETPLAPAMVGEMAVELAQMHGPLVAGEEGHLVIMLPYSDGGSTIVRAWVGTEDRTLSYVGKGDYAASHDDYDVHAIIPDPLPENAMWWIEVEKPDGTKTVGSSMPIRE